MDRDTHDMFQNRTKQEFLEENKITITRISMKQFLDMIDNAGKIRSRTVYLNPRNDMRLAAMESVSGISLTQMVNDMIKEYYEDGYDTTQG